MYIPTVSYNTCYTVATYAIEQIFRITVCIIINSGIINKLLLTVEDRGITEQ